MMNHNIYIFGYAFLVSLILSLILTKISLPILIKFGIVDKPSDRRSHNFITPRGAGIVFVFILLTLLPIFEYLLFNTNIFSFKLLPIIIPICTISFLDDIRDVSPISRFIIQSISALLAIFFILDIKIAWYNNFLPRYFIIFLLTIALISITNIYNFLDGIDGMTAAESIHLSITMIIICTQNMRIIPNAYLIILLFVLILGWALGFILFNWPPAKIFLGDTGSICLGFIIGICLIIISSVTINFAISSIIAFLYYIVDGGGTLITRLINREKIWEPHLNHFFQKANRQGMPNKVVLMHIIICNFLLMILSILGLFYPVQSFILASLVVFIVIKKFVSYEAY